MNKPLERKVITTKDGSNTLIIPELNEQYHSINGAIQESEHVFIQAGLNQVKNKDLIKVLEIGFGTGLNALLTANYAKNEIYYHSIEKYPLTDKEVAILKYTQFNKRLNQFENDFKLMHSCDWNIPVQITSKFKLFKEEVALKDFISYEKFNLVFFDAFAPDIQPDLWEEVVFKKLYNYLEPNGILVTYCAKGQVRRNMQSVGFMVERLPGPPGKREMLRAIKKV